MENIGAIIWFLLIVGMLAFSSSAIISQLIAGTARNWGLDYGSWGAGSFCLSFLLVFTLALMAWWIGALAPASDWLTPLSG